MRTANRFVVFCAGAGLLAGAASCGDSQHSKVGEAVHERSATTSSALLSAAWTSAVSMSGARQNHVAALLNNGSVLVAGGHTGNNVPIASAEVFSPATGAWTTVGSMGTARRLFGTCTLSSGKVLVAGGNAGVGDVASAELFDPSTGTWSTTGSMAAAREDFSTTCLSDGRVLVAGGSGPSGLLNGAEVYDPNAGTWSSAGTLPAAVHTQGAVLLNDGRVLIAGGNNASGPVNTAAIWSPSTNAWAATGSMSMARAFYALNLLGDGRVLAAGGLLNVLGGNTNTAEIYSPTAGTWSAAANLNTARYSGVSATLSAGPMVVGGVNGGSPLATSESYDSVHNTWTQLATVYGAVNQTATALSSSSVLVAGGNTGSQATKSAQTYGVLNVFAVYAQRSVTLGSSDHVNGGDVGVAAAAASTFGPQLVVGGSATMQTNHNLVAPSVSLASGAQVGDVQTNSLTNAGATLGTLAAYPSSMPPSPLSLPTGPGGSNVTVPAFTITTLNPGNYGNLSVTGTVYLNAGSYTFASVTMANQAHLAGVSGTSIVSVAGAFQAGNSVSISSPGSTPAGQLVIAVAGNNSGTTPAFSIGTGAAISAVLSAPNGTFSLGASSIATGAFAGFDVNIGTGVTINYQSGFSSTTSQGQQVVQGYSPLTTGAPLVGSVPQSTIVTLAIGLPLRNMAAAQQFIAQISDPSSSSFRHTLAPGQFASDYAPSSADYQAVQTFATSNGLTVTGTYDSKMLVDVSGTAGQVDQAFHLTLNYYLRPDGTQYYAPDRVPSLNLTATITGIVGIDSYQVLSFAGASGFGLPANYNASDLRRAYARCSPLTGTNQSIGLVVVGGFDPADIANYATGSATIPSAFTNYPVSITTGVPTVNVQAVGAPGYTPPNVDTVGETTADIELAMALAPNLSNIYVFEGDPSRGIQAPYDALAVAASTPYLGVLQMSSSFGIYPNTTSIPFLTALQMHNQSFFASSGDSGAYAVSTTPTVSLKTTPWPLTVVGGTTLFMNGSGASYHGEIGWVSSGGGNPWAYATPSFQTAFLANGASSVYENGPDVSMVAVGVQRDYQGGAGFFQGTSASAPLWAGFMALANEQLASNSGGSVGFANPTLYGVASVSSLYASCFNDVVLGSNPSTANSTGYSAGTGYDLVTGLGSPQCELIYQLGSTTPKTPVCPTGQGICGGSCASFASDSSNCGQCGHSCEGGTCVGGACQPITLASSQGAPDFIAVDSSNVYWTDFDEETVMQVPISGGSLVTVASGQRDPFGLAVNSSSVFWTGLDLHTGNAVVMKGPIGGGASTTLFSGPGNTWALWGIAANESDVFWDVAISNGGIMKTPVGGGTPTALAIAQGTPSFLAIDGNNVYWTTDDNNTGNVGQVAQSGGTPVTLASGQPGPYGVAVYGGNVYYGIAGSSGSIRAVAVGGGSVVTLATSQSRPVSVAADESGVYWVDTNSTNGLVMRDTVVIVSGSFFDLGGAPIQLAGSQSSPFGVATDATSIYWTNQGSGGLTGSVMKLAKPW